MSDDDFPRYDSCRERGEGGCKRLRFAHTQLGPGYACPECQMTYIYINAGTLMPYDRALELAIQRRKQS